MTAEQKELIKQLAQMGDVVLISDNQRINLDENGNISLNTQAEAILYFLQRLDINMVSCILEDIYTYQNFEKSLFVKKLGVALDEFIEGGDTYLNRYSGFCNAKTCNYKCNGFTFVGNNSGNYFNLIIDINEGVVQDIYECFFFKRENKEIKKNKNIEINRYDEPFLI